ncbi:hypothetical protein [Parendozoicomonas sp. Alg238-R29]|uniref:hypothetical protein n=1 Tax=Parendozoicomonas sp. Alg238-R29 TaxID=2993446 RepID=UPI00248E7A2D|nr:hypothetical protein [Parendozoicomonas sp. Alg238-R29]
MSKIRNMPRLLTAGEIKICKTVFDNNVNYSTVRVYHESFFPFGMQPNNVAMAPNGNIYFDPAGELYEQDFSKADIHAQALLVHEMVHVWQHQKGINVKLRGTFERTYKYLPLTPDKKFADYNIEQQGDIVRDFFYLLNGYKKSEWPHISVYRKLIPFEPLIPSNPPEGQKGVVN